MAKMHITSSTGENRVIELTREDYNIGRGENNSIRLSDARSSRYHAHIFSQNEGLYLEDSGSANGTFINGSRIAERTPVLLQNNDQITIGQTTMRLSGLNPPTEPESMADAEFQEYSPDGQLFNSSDYDSEKYELSSTLDASISFGQLSAEESQDTANMLKALKRMEAMCTISAAIGNIMELPELMDKVIATVFEIFPKADRAFILLQENSGFTPVAVRTRNRQDISLKELKISTTILQKCTTELLAILSNNTSEDDRFNNAQSIAELAIDSFICSPLIIGTEALGIIQVEGIAGTEEFDNTDLQILTGISSQIAIGVKNIQLANDIKKESARRADLQRYFSPNMVDMLLNGDINTELGGKMYTGTVFFSDIIGFTAMSEKMPAEEVVTNLNHYFTIMQNLIYRNKGNVDKFGGDAIMAFWSVPRHNTTDEAAAVLTGIQMQGELHPFNAELRAAGIPTINMGIGINTGDFVAGNIGSADKIEFTLIGDNVNLAARIEARAGKTQVMCSQETYTLIASKVCAIELPPVSLKGKSKPQQIYSIRAIETTRGSLTSCIPLRTVTDSNELSQEISMLTAITSRDTDKELIITTDTTLALSERIKFRCCLNEYHQRIEFTGFLRNKKDQETPSGKTYFQYTLDCIQGELFLKLIKAGFTCKTELSWDMMPREKELKGN